MKLKINIDRPDLSYEEIASAKKSLASMEFGYSERVTPEERSLVSKYKQLLRLVVILKELEQMGFNVKPV